MWRIIESVPGSDAAAPSPMMTLPAIKVSAFWATAATIEPQQNRMTPDSITFFRPSWSPSVPKSSMKLANTSA